MCHSGFLGTLSVDEKSGIQQCATSMGEKKKISLFIHSPHFTIMPLTSIEVRHRELRRQIKEQRLGFVRKEEVRIK